MEGNGKINGGNREKEERGSVTKGSEEAKE